MGVIKKEVSEKQKVSQSLQDLGVFKPATSVDELATVAETGIEIKPSKAPDDAFDPQKPVDYANNDVDASDKMLPQPQQVAVAH